MNDHFSGSHGGKNSGSRLAQQKSSLDSNFGSNLDSRSQFRDNLSVTSEAGKMPAAQLQASTGNATSDMSPIPENKTGLPHNLKAGIENLSGYSMDDVRVHYNSVKPTQLQAHAFAQGTDIHVAPGQEQHLPHEAWHVVQQKQGRVQPTLQMKGSVNVNDDTGLEREADVMGSRAELSGGAAYSDKVFKGAVSNVVQKASVEQVTAGQLQSATPVLQMVSVDVARQIPVNSAVTAQLLQTAIDTMKSIVEAAEGAGGLANSGPEHQRLEGILANPALQNALPGSSNATYGLGGSNYFGNTPFTTTQGPVNFNTAVSSIPHVGSTENLGNRASGFHDEMHQISAYPGLQALASSQGHCFFCYGTIHARGYQHGAVRGTDPWPQDWKHDYLGFKLKKTSSAMESIAHSTDPVIKITSDTHGVRYYFVSRA